MSVSRIRWECVPKQSLGAPKKWLGQRQPDWARRSNRCAMRILAEVEAAWAQGVATGEVR